ncbi:hypothetical protein [Pseudorhodoplanes sp.]|uniref:hypothetical protein n=1 Tax=Pseudorhodoplanes sp. TaxID=1934341 RepID=UPI003D0C171C
MRIEEAAAAARSGPTRPAIAVPKISAADETFRPVSEFSDATLEENTMHSIIYIIGLIVVIMAVLSFFGLR